MLDMGKKSLENINMIWGYILTPFYYSISSVKTPQLGAEGRTSSNISKMLVLLGVARYVVIYYKGA